MVDSPTTDLPPASAFSHRRCRRVAEDKDATRHLLLVDNEPDICVLVQDALAEFEGWQVTTCCDPSTVDFETTPHWDAILLEISVTRLTGVALVTALQIHPKTYHIPIVLLTSHVMARDYAQFEQMGVTGVIAKPFDPVTLGHQIAQLLDWVSTTSSGSASSAAAIPSRKFKPCR
ncbi:response regulator [Nodosilinea sp. LEGE 07298]|uniref:response regulator n=1 Tax=Nodosilinea sp. LEGE 07298 TaxID=2777970 RepID=UPI0018809245|nr:response regulator [Nodosilinea sp. LEGE 07298]MBE9110693.1 response regulator [Nodosilinea sp. LEGE 07298]